MSSFDEYCMLVQNLYNANQGTVLARMLSLSDDHVRNENLWSCEIPASITGNSGEELPYEDLLIKHLSAVKALHVEDYVAVYKHQITYITAMTKLFESQTGTNWMVPVMFTACADLRMSALKADNKIEGTTSFISDAADTIIPLIKICTSDTATPRENSKLKGLLNPVNHALRMYFRAKKYDDIKAIIKLVDPIVIGGEFPIGDEVTYRFNVGRLAVVEEDFRAANKHLIIAFRKCNSLSNKNKKIILTYLMPVKMILGYLPVQHFTETYNVPIFWSVACAVRDGKIKTYEEILDKNRRFFANLGLLTALDHLRLVVYRNIFRKVYLSSQSNSIPVASFQAGLQLMSESNIDAATTESLISTMIYNHKIKAYMSYRTKNVVFHPHDPFPCSSTMNHPGFYLAS